MRRRDQAQGLSAAQEFVFLTDSPQNFRKKHLTRKATAYIVWLVRRLTPFGLRVQEQVDFGLESLVQAIEYPEDSEPRQRNLMPRYIPGET